jgi:hypothetical protein
MFTTLFHLKKNNVYLALYNKHLPIPRKEQNCCVNVVHIQIGLLNARLMFNAFFMYRLIFNVFIIA